jgi:hypothetical protein
MNLQQCSFSRRDVSVFQKEIPSLPRIARQPKAEGGSASTRDPLRKPANEWSRSHDNRKHGQP